MKVPKYKNIVLKNKFCPDLLTMIRASAASEIEIVILHINQPVLVLIALGIMIGTIFLVQPFL